MSHNKKNKYPEYRMTHEPSIWVPGNLLRFGSTSTMFLVLEIVSVGKEYTAVHGINENGVCTDRFVPTDEMKEFDPRYSLWNKVELHDK